MEKLEVARRLPYFPYIIYFAIIILSPVIIFSFFKGPLLPVTTAAQNAPSYPCNCAIFRFDDVTEFGSNVKTAILDHFIIENKKLVVAIILDKFGNNASNGIVYAKVKEGFDKSLFELAIHGWNHTRYSELTEGQQREDFIKTNNKLLLLFGNKSRIFVPPFNEFNHETIRAMAESGLDIFSTSYYQENITSNPYKISNLSVTNKSNIQLSEVIINDSGSKQTLKETIYHAPYNTALLHLTREGYAGGNLTDKVLSNVDKNIDKYGFSVITLHPTDFAVFNSTTGKHTKYIDPIKFQVLVDIIDRLEVRGISLADYSDIIPAPSLREIPKVQQEQRPGNNDTDILVEPVAEDHSFPEV